MIVKEEWTCEIVCDGCGESAGIFDEEDFSGALMEARALGFTEKKLYRKVWENFCPKCARDLWAEEIC